MRKIFPIDQRVEIYAKGEVDNGSLSDRPIAVMMIYGSEPC